MLLRATVLALIFLGPVAALGFENRAGADDKTVIPTAAGVHKELALADDEQLYSCKSKTGDVSISFKPEIEVKELLIWAMSFTCKEFIYDPRIIATSKKVTIIAPNKMSPPEAYRLFLAALATINYTLVPKGKALRVVESETGKRETLPIYKTGLPDGNDQMVRYVYRPTYAPPETLIQAFNSVKSAPGEIQPIGAMVLVTDYASHIQNMLTLAKLVDVPRGADGIYLIPVLHADAKKLSDEVGALMVMQAGAPPPAGKPGDPKPAIVSASAAPSKMIVDERTNTIVVAASEAGYNRVKALVDRLDIALDIEGGTTFHVYKLGGSIAEELAKTLNEAISGQSQAKPTPGKPGTPPAPPVSADPTSTALEGAVHVIADKPTNALIVMSSGRDFLAIKELIKQLDLARRQVYIETVILEVSVGNNLDFGTSAHGVLPGTNGSLLVGGAQLPELKSTSYGSLSATGLIGGLLGEALPGSKALFGQSIPSYGLLFQALAKNSNTNVISAEHIIGIDNEETKHKVGVSVPYLRGSIQGLGDNSSLQQLIDRKDLNLELNIKPHISFDDTVMLEIKHEAAELGTVDKALGPSFNTRAIETKVVVRNQQTVVIGGLTQERDIYSSSKVPILGDIPILGHLFKYTSKEKRKTSLLIMLTPYIVKDQMDLQMIQERKHREHQEFVSSFKSLDGAKYNAKMDYRRKRGLIEEINRTVIGFEEDATARASFRQPPRVEPGPVLDRAPEDRP